jgi:hypothetical protein
VINPSAVVRATKKVIFTLQRSNITLTAELNDELNEDEIKFSFTIIASLCAFTVSIFFCELLKSKIIFLLCLFLLHQVSALPYSYLPFS